MGKLMRLPSTRRVGKVALIVALGLAGLMIGAMVHQASATPYCEEDICNPLTGNCLGMEGWNGACDETPYGCKNTFCL